MTKRKLCISLLSLLLLLPALPGWAEDPALYRVTADKVNVRAGPGTNYTVVDRRNKGDIVTVLGMYNSDWAKIKFKTVFAYMSRKYLVYEGPVSELGNQQQVSEVHEKTHKGIWDSLFGIVKAIMWICAIVIVISGAFESEWGGAALLLQIITALGGLAGWLITGNPKAGAVIGLGIGIILAIRYAAYELAWDFDEISWLTYLLWYLISLPFYILDLFQFWLAKPWRPFLKKNRLSDKAKSGRRKLLRILQIPFYIALFPLRFVNAVYYNILIHNLYELSNYVLELAIPSDREEGGSGFFRWILFFPIRFVKYLVYHGSLTIIESLIWTVIDTFVPALTLYHGTYESSADSMLCDPKRNKQRKRSSGWLSGIWNVGGGNYAGDGIYFGIFRKTLRNYQKGSAIVARVTMGKTIDVVLMPDNVYSQAGHPNASAVSDWGLNHGYVSGEWWRSDRFTQWWEICLFDRQNRYNDSWRIRPIYAIDSDTGIMQRISGGTAHWFFREMVLKDLWNSIKRVFE